MTDKPHPVTHWSKEQFRKHGYAVIDWLAEYREQLERLPVQSAVSPGEIRSALPPGPPQQAESFAELMKDLDQVIVPGLMPSLIASGAIAFATAMGAFGTAFTLATDIDGIPMVIYTEFTLSANIAMASALSIVLGIVTWVLLLIARSLSGSTVAAGG